MPDHKSRRCPLLVAFVVAAVAATALPAIAGTPEEERLAETRAQIERIHAEIEAASAEVAGGEDALADAEARVTEVLEAVGQAELAVQRQQQAVEQAKDRLGDLEHEARRQQRLTRARVAELYKQGAGVPFASVLSSANPREALDRSALVGAVSRSDRESFERVSASQVAVAAQREVLEREEAALRNVLADQRALLADVEAIRQERAIALSASAERLNDLQHQEADLEAESDRLAALARRAAQAPPAPSRSAPVGDGTAAQPAPAPAPAPVSGEGWTWPAAGPLTSGFGYRWGRMHEGIDIGAPTGAPTVAARAGVVIHAGSMSGYGYLVLVDHGDGFVTAYAHHSAIYVSPGQQVSAGQQLGAVGCTGSCTGPHLHFEVRVGGAPQDPLAYLP